ncbi:MAG: DinB family protein [Bryobacteraceae bacterium]
MDLVCYFQMLARYNRTANERFFEKCAELDDVEYRKQREGSFGSIHGLLNHILLGDRIWMARFEGTGRTTPVLTTILFDEFSELRSARREQDTLIERFFERLPADFLGASIQYTNSSGMECVEAAPVAIGHLFNHQTHHRGQVHVMLSQTPVRPPSLDLHRILNPVGR